MAFIHNHKSIHKNKTNKGRRCVCFGVDGESIMSKSFTNWKNTITHNVWPVALKKLNKIDHYSFFTLTNSDVLEKYFWLASATFFSAACGFTISKPWRRTTPTMTLKHELKTKNNAWMGVLWGELQYLKRSKSHAGTDSRRAVSDGRLAPIRHALLLQCPLDRATNTIPFVEPLLPLAWFLRYSHYFAFL